MYQNLSKNRILAIERFLNYSAENLKIGNISNNFLVWSFQNSAGMCFRLFYAMIILLKNIKQIQSKQDGSPCLWATRYFMGQKQQISIKITFSAALT